MNSHIITEQLPCENGYIGVIRLNRQQALNALSFSMFKTLTQTLKLWAIEPDIHAVIIRAEPGKAFSAGGDIREVYQFKQNDPEKLMHYFALEYRFDYLTATYPKPYIALLDGLTFGGGAGIAMHGSHPIATENFLFAMPETGIGFYPDIGASHWFAKMPYPVACYLALTGARITVKQAIELELIKYCLPQNRLNDFILQLQKLDLSKDAHAKVTQTCLQLEATDLHPEPLQHLDIINQCFSKHDLKAIFTALENHSHPFAKQSLEKLQQCSPTSLHVTLELLHKTRHMNLEECLQTDFRLTMKFCEKPDFFAGIRALLIDKDKNPKWQPNTINDVSPTAVKHYFATTMKNTLLL